MLRQFVRWLKLLGDCDTQTHGRHTVRPFLILKQIKHAKNEARNNGHLTFLETTCQLSVGVMLPASITP
jgi:hypothetical protein